jgi:radical SAM protein with 4Fe4S-binding SPASM domain
MNLFGAKKAKQSSAVVDPSEAFFPRMPPLNIELSSKCNLKCPYCANPTLTREYENLPDDLFHKIVREAKEMGGQIWSLHGVGEPLLRRDLEALLKVIDATGIWSKWIVTNAALLNPARMKSLYEAGVRGVYNSLDTMDSDLYRRTRGGKVEKAIDNVIAAAAAYPQVPFMVGLMNHREQVVDDRVREQFKATYGHLPNVTMHVYENGRFPGAGEDWRRQDGDFPLSTEVCFSPSSHFTIDARGEVALCCADQNTDFSLGNVRDKTLHEIWFDRKNQDTFRKIALGLSDCPSVCYKCVLVPSSRKIEDTEPVLWGPFAELLKASRKKRGDGEIAEAKRFMDFALLRDPQNEKVKAELAELEKLTGVYSRSYFQQYLDGAG